MVRRAVAFAVAIALSGAPVATVLCEAQCSTHHSHAQHGHAQHQHHDGTAVARSFDAAGATLAAAAHVCDEVAAVVTQFRDRVGASADIALLDVPVMTGVSTPSTLRGVNVRHGPPIPPLSLSALRI